MLRKVFRRSDLKRAMDGLHRRVDEQISSPGYDGEIINGFREDLEELQREIESLLPGEPRIVGRKKLAFGFVSLILLIAIAFLSTGLFDSSEDNAIDQSGSVHQFLSDDQGDHVGNGLSPAVFESVPTSNRSVSTEAAGDGIFSSPGEAVNGELLNVAPLEWHFLDSIDGSIRGEQTSFYADGYVYYISKENYTMGEVTGDGQVTQWINIGKPLPAYDLEAFNLFAVEYHEATNSVYFAGGMSGFDTAHREVFRCEIQPDHTLGDWVEVNSMTTGRFAPTLRTGEGPNGEQFLYAVSGADSNWGFLDTVEFAQINPDGTLADWYITSSLNHPRPTADGFFHDGKLYVFGGGRHSLRNNTVEAASVRHDGHLSNWEIVGTMGNYRSQLGVAFVSQTEKVYVIGGYTGEYGQETTNTTEVADISDLNDWKPDGKLKGSMINLSAMATPESIIVIGRPHSPEECSTAQYARIFPPNTGTGQYDGL